MTRIVCDKNSHLVLKSFSYFGPDDMERTPHYTARSITSTNITVWSMPTRLTRLNQQPK